jgi:putative PEP-CTERM system histidine kinase
VTNSTLATAGIWSYGLAAAAFVAFAIRLALGWRSSRHAVLLLAATFATALWAASGAAFAESPSASTWWLSSGFDTLRYALWLAFMASLLRGTPSASGGEAVASGLPRLVVALVAGALVASMALTIPVPFDVVSGEPGGTAPYAVRLGLAVFGLIFVEQLFRRAQPESRWAIKPLCLGLAGVFAFDLYYYADAMMFDRLDANAWLARGIANALVIPFIAVATARNTGWTIEMHVSRSAVFHSTAILVSGVFLLAIAAAGYLVRFIGGEWGSAVQIAFSFAALMVAVLVLSSGSFRSRLRVFVSKHFFSYRYDYREEWLRFTRTLSAEGSPQGLQENCVRALADLVESPAGALWLKREDRVFVPAARWNMPALDAVEPAQGSLARFLERTSWVVNLDEYAADPGRYPDLQLPEWMRSVPAAWVITPLVSGNELIGFVVLTTPRARIEVNWEVLDLLKAASRQAASYLGQVRATEALLEARKFDAFNRMSAFVVHDLKNLVAQLSLMLKNAQRHRDNPEFQRDMLATVEHVVARMNQLMLQLRTEVTPVEKARLTDLEAVVRRVCAAKTGQRAPIELRLDPGVLGFGHEDRLEHVIGHLIQNALDATAESGTVLVRLAREGDRAVVEVVDTGIGMTAEFARDRLFKPFETTKASGMGIGVYESAQYVNAVGGQIVIDSEPNVGTRVRVSFASADASLAPAEPGAIA